MSDPIRTPAEALSAKPATFIHLKVHSAYSLLEGALPIGKITKLAEKAGFPAVALTDTNNLFGTLEFSDKLAAAGIQPIAGISLAVDFEEKKPEQRLGSPAPALRLAPNWDGLVALYATSEAGYASLMKLASKAHLGTADGETPHVKISDIERHATGLIALTGGPDGPIDLALRNDQTPVAEARLGRLAALFPDRLYVEIQRHGTPPQQQVEPRLLELAYRTKLPIVATNECYFAAPDDYEAHDALLCIAEGRYVSEDDRRRVTREHGFKSAEAMAKVFHDLPEALANTIEIARRCAYRPRGRKPILPSFVQVGDGASDNDKLAAEAAELERQAKEGLARRLDVTPLAPGFTREDYEKRLAYEVGVIAQMKFPGYFLIVSDFIKWSKQNGIPVGPGRGSGAGSLVAWALTITDLDPLRFALLFERFLNPERVSMPDFDIDFCQDRREETIRYVQQKYGVDRVAQIITHGKLQARAVLRDVGRVLQMPYGQVDRLCKLVPNNPANPVTLEEAIAGEPKLQEERDSEPVVARLLEIAQKLEGLYRHASTHAAGMVIGDRPLDELVPLYRDPKSTMPVTQFNMKLVETAGLVKFDFLGLKTLTVLKKAVDLIKAGRNIDVDLAALPLDDRKSYELLARAETVGVFQLESTGMRDSLKRLKPDRFEDIIAMVALYRPGPMDNIPTYINRKHGEEPIDYPHAMIKPILEETYGVIIYQEQVIQIAQVMGGYSLGQADLLRRAMGKKDKNEMAKQQARFVEGAMANGVKKDDAVYIFELVDKFAGYGFNKSHAAAYALVSYHTAYLKAHYPEEFLAASMTLDMGNTDKLAMFAGEARRMGIRIAPPCINMSGVDFGAEAGPNGTPGAIRYSLAALKNIGAGAVETIVAERSANGTYGDLSDFARRLNPKALNKRALETLAAAGSFEAVESNRALVHGNVEQLIALSQRLAESAETGIDDLFGGGASAGAAKPKVDLRPVKNWTPMERLDMEFEAVGFFLSGHPLDGYDGVLAEMGVRSYTDFLAAVERGASAGRLAGIVVSARERRSQKGNKFAFAMFSDRTGQFEAVIFSDTLARSGHLLEAGTPVCIGVEAESDGESVKMRVQSLEALDAAAALMQKGVRIVVDGTGLNGRAAKAVAELSEMLRSCAPGPSARGSEVRLLIEVAERGQALEIAIPGRFDTGPNQRGLLSTVPGVVAVVDL
jgi:DNA polymerase-3 subunit alpha